MDIAFAEDRLYNALWNYRNARNDGDCRLVTVGWDLMAQLSGMTPNTRGCASATAFGTE